MATIVKYNNVVGWQAFTVGSSGGFVEISGSHDENALQVTGSIAGEGANIYFSGSNVRLSGTLLLGDSPGGTNALIDDVQVGDGTRSNLGMEWFVDTNGTVRWSISDNQGGFDQQLRWVHSSQLFLRLNNSDQVVWDADQAAYHPDTDVGFDLGMGSKRWNTLYANTGSFYAVTASLALLAGAEEGDGAPNAGDLVIGDGSASPGMTLYADANGAGRYAITDVAGAQHGELRYDLNLARWQFEANGNHVANMNSAAIWPQQDDDIALGTSNLRWSNGYFGNLHTNGSESDSHIILSSSATKRIDFEGDDTDFSVVRFRTTGSSDWEIGRIDNKNLAFRRYFGGSFQGDAAVVDVSTGDWSFNGDVYVGGDDLFVTGTASQRILLSSDTDSAVLTLDSGVDDNVEFDFNTTGSNDWDIYRGAGRNLEFRRWNAAGGVADRTIIDHGNGNWTFPAGIIQDEQSSAPATVASDEGLWWVRDDNPTTGMYTDSDDFDRDVSRFESIFIQADKFILDGSDPPSTTTLGDHPLLTFVGNNTLSDPEVAYCYGVMPPTYGGQPITVRIWWAPAGVTPADVEWGISWERIQDFSSLTTSGFDTEQTEADTEDTIQRLQFTDIVFQQSEADNVVADDPFRIRIRRDPDASADTSNNNAYLWGIEIFENV